MPASHPPSALSTTLCPEARIACGDDRTGSICRLAVLLTEDRLALLIIDATTLRR